MSLSQRLAEAKRSQVVEAPQQREAPPVEFRGRTLGRKDPFAEVKRSVHAELLASLGPKLYDPHMTQSDLEAQVRQTLQVVVDQQQTPLSNADRARLTQEVSDDILGYGPLEPLLSDPEITEVMVNGHDQIYVEASGKLTLSSAQFADEPEAPTSHKKRGLSLRRRGAETPA